MLRGSKKNIKESQNVEHVTGAVSNGINEMSSGIEQINQAVHRISTLSMDNHHHINILVQEISRFKVA
jgi:methyl-accepting chemotaxis protein